MNIIIKDKILENAMKLFIQNGYKCTSIKVIAQKSGVSESTVFRYFKSKENLLYEAIYLITPDDERIYIKDLTYGSDIVKDFSLLIKCYMELIIKQTPVFRIFMLDILYDKNIYYRIWEKAETISNHFERYLQDLYEKDKIINADFKTLSDYMFSIILIESFDFKFVQSEDKFDENKIDIFAKNYANFFYSFLVKL